MVFKKYLAFALVFSLFSFPGCSKKDPNRIVILDEEQQDESVYADPSDNDRTVILSELGLKYTTPDLWREYETTNIYPETIASEGFFAQIIYSFVTEEGLEALNDVENKEKKVSDLYPICQIVVLDKNNLETVGVQSVFDQYKIKDELEPQGDYVYYVLSDYQGDISSLRQEDKEKYEKTVSAVPDLMKSAKTYPFDADTLKESTEKLENTLTFNTTTLKGEPINSTVFASYDLTMFNFGATYANDESAVLEEVQKKINAEPSKKLHLLAAYIDTPDTDTTEAGKKLRQDQSASYDTLMMDETLGTWAKNKLTGVPTTVFVDANGQIVGQPIEGAKTADEYWILINEMLEETK